MTVTYINLENTWEHFDLTISNLLSTFWDSTNTNSITPKFASATGTNVTHSWPSNTKFGTNQIHCNETRSYPTDENSNNGSFQCMKTEVTIDVWGSDANNLKLMLFEINRILWQYNPDSGLRVQKSTGTANADYSSNYSDDYQLYEFSPIHRFDPPTVRFVKERLMDEKEKQIAHGKGTLTCVWYKLRA